MKTFAGVLLIGLALIVASGVNGEDVKRTKKKIDWYGTLELGLEEAKRTNKPIFLLSAAPQCLGVPGIW